MKSVLLLSLLILCGLNVQAFDRYLTQKQKKKVEEMIRVKEYEQCLNTLDGWTKGCRKDYSLWMYKGICYNHLKDARAAETLEKAYELCGDQVERNQVRIYLAEGYYVSGQKEKCTALCETLLADAHLDQATREWTEQMAGRMETGQVIAEQKSSDKESQQPPATIQPDDATGKKAADEASLAEERKQQQQQEALRLAEERKQQEKQQALQLAEEKERQARLAEMQAQNDLKQQQAKTRQASGMKKVAPLSIAGYERIAGEPETELHFLKGNATYMPLFLGNEKTHEEMLRWLKSHAEQLRSGKVKIRIEATGNSEIETIRKRTLYVKGYLMQNAGVKESDFMTISQPGGSETVKLYLIRTKN